MVDSSRQPYPSPLYGRSRGVSWLLWACGLIDCLAAVVACLPDSWLQGMNVATGLGQPTEPITWYLARSSSLMYAAHGLLLLYLSFHVLHYLRLIRFLAFVAIGHGLVLILVDLKVGMPWWWTALEGPLLVSWGSVVMCLLPMTMRWEGEAPAEPQIARRDGLNR